MKPIKIYPILFLFVCLTGSCMETYEEEFPSLSSLVIQNPFFKKLESALVKSKLWLKLSNPNPSEESVGDFTLFGPTDDAFEDFEKTTGTSIKDIGDSTLRQLLLYHLMEGQQDRMDLEESSRFSSSLGPEIKIIKKEADLYVNGARLLFTDVETKNGRFHGLDKVLLGFEHAPLAFIDLLNEKKLLNSHSFFIMQKAIELSDLNSEFWMGSTFILPTDDAFHVLGLNHPNDLSSWSVQKIKKLVGNHLFIDVDRFSPEFPFSEINLLGQLTNISIDELGRWFIKEGNITTTANPILCDIRSDQGVIHIIDQVIFPSY